MPFNHRESLDRELGRIHHDLGNVTFLLRTFFEEEDGPVHRAEEARAAVQRLIWVIEREVRTAGSEDN
jgi:hypothetical protein